MKKFGIVTLAMLISLSVLAGEIHACACCAEAGLWHRAKVRPGGEEPQMLKTWAESVKKANLMVGNADLAEFGQISPTAKSSLFDLPIVQVTASGVDVQFKDSVSGGIGGLRLGQPAKAMPTQFMADIRDGKTSEGGGVLLYKELVFEGSVRGSGFFRKGIPAGTPYKLVLQGRGNGCHDASSYKSWVLKAAGLTFYGEMGT